MIGGRRPISGRKPGDKRVRVERHHCALLPLHGPGPADGQGRGQRARRRRWAGRVARLKHTLHRAAAGQRGGDRPAALEDRRRWRSSAPTRSRRRPTRPRRSSSRSSSAGAAGAAFNLSVPIAVAIALLLGIVAFSYRQVCLAYPTGGGSYSVSKANFGRMASLVAASALMIDYTLTVAVSTSSAVEQLSSAIPALDPVRVEIALLAIGLITLGNLRGLREAGNIFAIPTYLFLGSAFLMIGIGTIRILFPGDTGPRPDARGHRRDPADRDGHHDPDPAPGVRVRRGRADRHRGDRHRRACLQAARSPERRADADGHGRDPRDPVHRDHVPRDQLPHHADRGAHGRRSSPRSRATCTATAASGSTCSRLFTALLLFLAANTSFAAFPRLAALLAEDGFIPRQFAFRGDRLAFSSGILLLGSIAAAARRRRRRVRARPDPAVRGRRVHRLHDLAGGHGPALDPDQVPGLAPAAHDQRGRLRAHGRHRDRRDVGQVLRRRLAGHAADPDAGRA